MLKVANIIEDGRLAGPQLRILSVAALLAAQGVETTVIHPVYESREFALRLDDAGIPRRALPISRLSRGWRAILRYAVSTPCEIFLLWRIFRREEFDFVHCSGGFWQVKGLVAAKLAGRRALWHLNDTILPVRFRAIFRLAATWFAHKLIFAGRRVREHYLAGAPSPVPSVEIQAPVDCQRFDPSRARPDPAISAARGVKIITVANLNPLKGLEYFVRMAALVTAEVPDSSFHIVGPVFESQNDYLARLTKMLAEFRLTNVRFHGSSNDIPGVLAAADIFVCSSVAEASPTSVWEAMAMEKAIVSTDVGDVSRFVVEGVSGIVVPPGDSAALASGVLRFLRDPGLRKSCGAAARKAALENLDLPVCVAAHLRAYA